VTAGGFTPHEDGPAVGWFLDGARFLESERHGMGIEFAVPGTAAVADVDCAGSSMVWALLMDGMLWRIRLDERSRRWRVVGSVLPAARRPSTGPARAGRVRGVDGRFTREVVPMVEATERGEPEISLAGLSRRYKHLEPVKLIGWVVVGRTLYWFDVGQSRRGSFPPLPGELAILAADMSNGARAMTSDGEVWAHTAGGWRASGRVAALAAAASGG
jgi:hypothetical protein